VAHYDGEDWPYQFRMKKMPDDKQLGDVVQRLKDILHPSRLVRLHRDEYDAIQDAILLLSSPAQSASQAEGETPRADAIVDAYLEKCDRIFPDGSSAEDIERDLLNPIRQLERENRDLKHKLEAAYRVGLAQERELNAKSLPSDSQKEDANGGKGAWSLHTPKL
jgi:hypothetical protein